MHAKVSLVGAPTDIGAGTRGASMGPEALRVAGLQQTLEAHGVEVVDRGNLGGPGNPWLPPVDGYRHLAEVVAWNRRCTTRCMANWRSAGCRSCSAATTASAIGSISAVARHCRETGKKLRVLWLDAHADFNTSVLTPSGNMHGMPVACLCGHGPQELVEIGGTVPAINPKAIRQIGIRSVDPGEKRFVHQVGPGGLRHALHRRDGHAPHDGAGAGHAGREHAPARQLRRRLPRPGDRPRRAAPPCPAGRPTARRSCAWR